MKTFFIQTLGCKVNHYESEQIATLLRSRGLVPAPAKTADLRIVHSCSVTTQAASQSRQSVRRLTRLSVLQPSRGQETFDTLSDPTSSIAATSDFPASSRRPRVVVTGCWATSNSAEAAALPGVDAVLGHHQDLCAELDKFLALWRAEYSAASCESVSSAEHKRQEEIAKNPAGQSTTPIQPKSPQTVNGNLGEVYGSTTLIRRTKKVVGTTSLPLLGQRQSTRQRAFLKIQDGCDAHCTYCIIPTLRPTLWSKPIEAVVQEAQALTAAGHFEIILTGIFLGAYGQPTALRRRQPQSTARPLGQLIDTICTNVPDLRRLRLSSLEPGDLTDELIDVLKRHPQIVPHFHLPLQSGSDTLLRQMNRQYTRDDFLAMIDRVNSAFDRPALTTDIVVGFPGETDAEFERTAEIVRASQFIHVHAFPYSPRPGTAAARWTEKFVRGPIVNERIARLRDMAAAQSFAFRSTFLGETVQIIIERDPELESTAPTLRHGRCERYFPVHVDEPHLATGDNVIVQITRVTPEATFGQIVKS